MRTRIWLAVGMCLALGASLVLGACGGSGGSSSSGGGESSGGVSKTDLARYEKELEGAYKGTYSPPTGGPVKTTPGKNVWLISAAQSAEAPKVVSEIIEETGAEWGWKVHTFDGRFEPNRELTGVEQAIAAGAEGIALLFVDCAPVEAGLKRAKEAGIVVIGVESSDCEPSLETNVQFAEGEDFIEHEENGFGGTQAKWVIGQTKGEAKTITTVETDTETTKAIGRGVKKAFAECPTCEIVEEIEFVGTELGPELQQKIEQALNKHPEANSFIANYDTVITAGGGAAALRASGRLSELSVIAGEGSAQAIELIYDENGNDACVGDAFPPIGYETATLLARGFAGQDLSKSSSGVGAQACDKEHNLPPKGKGYEAPIDYLAEYEKLWE